MNTFNLLLVCIAAALPTLSSAWMTMSLASGLPMRRSVAKFTSDPIPEGAIHAAVEAATMAPNHFLSEPTRMYDLGPETVAKLSELNPEKAKMFSGVPGWMLVTIKTEHLDENGGISAKLALEDHATVSCATQNFMQSLTEDGVGSKWMTGALGLAPEDILKAAGVGEGELMVGMIWYGMPAKPLEELKAPKRKLSVEDVLTKVA
mmetsp:Transcript_21146/g.32068  ORF Transcript_21146/g.32068 Transcript_21146/m.32068 type:complete len:205 (+) Transcript_21146:235-849(+)|eukprot:CAMPEP_0196133992 /NCGR_PEP_ID=MMETSP0910-20130528/3000_1 /TAXON_ID=49265 /ORGANISM="Thalassiosira rotula, Strain GSO102" /LENGTH=204 /DNA_ID=CAMNT_0041393781 /DNA_START=99 /DNA_END=713 /DNA_ORIENTATION=+